MPKLTIDEKNFSWHDFLWQAWSLPINWQHEQRVIIQTDEPKAGLLLMLASLLKGKSVVLDPKRSLSQGFILQNYEQQDLPKPTLTFLQLKRLLFHNKTKTCLFFCTSGSTGKPKLIRKNWSVLLAEAKALKHFYQLQKESYILCLASPFHLYGFLHGFLLPFLAEASTVLFTHPAIAVIEKSPSCDLLVSSPALWQQVKQYCQKQIAKIVVSSGAPFGRKRRTEINDLKIMPQAMWEILGSTETGGLGYRSLFAPEDRCYRLFPGINLSWRQHKLYVSSPYIMNKLLAIADLLETTGDGKGFYHRGRLDKVFKYSGRRYCLTEIEKALTSTLGLEAVACRFGSDPDATRGGILTAFVRGNITSLSQARIIYRSQTDLPFPDKFHFMAELRQDHMGKTVLPFN